MFYYVCPRRRMYRWRKTWKPQKKKHKPKRKTMSSGILKQHWMGMSFLRFQGYSTLATQGECWTRQAVRHWKKKFAIVWYVLSANIWLITCRDERYSIVRFFPLACGPRILLYVDSVLAVYIVCANCSCAILQCVVRVRAILVHWNWMLMNESICCI